MKHEPRLKAKGWLLAKGILQKDIQAALNHRYPTQVSETLQGKRDHRKVLKYIKELGCPVAFLRLPQGMRGEI